MCRSKAEGGARCAAWKTARAISVADIVPDSAHGVPEVQWAAEAEKSVQEIWEQYPHETAAATLSKLQDCVTKEPKITQDVITACEQAGVGTHGLEFRVKSPESLARKIQDDIEVLVDSGAAQEQATQRVLKSLGDVLRYTALSSDQEALVTDAKQVVKKLQEQGWELNKVKDFYTFTETYKGLHTIWTTPQGERVEVQFQSVVSQEIKDRVHPWYEVMRDKSVSEQKRERAKRECCREYRDLDLPKGLEDMENLGGCDIYIVGK